MGSETRKRVFEQAHFLVGAARGAVKPDCHACHFSFGQIVHERQGVPRATIGETYVQPAPPLAAAQRRILFFVFFGLNRGPEWTPLIKFHVLRDLDQWVQVGS